MLVLMIFIASSIWVGSVIGGLAWLLANAGHGSSPNDLLEVLASPLLLINLWIIPNVAFLAVAVTILMIHGNFSYLFWGILVGVESLFVMLGETFGFDHAFGYHSTLKTVLVWFGWLILIVMAETGIWLFRNMRMNRWAQEMAALSAENAMRRAEREAAMEEDPSDAGL